MNTGFIIWVGENGELRCESRTEDDATLVATANEIAERYGLKKEQIMTIVGENMVSSVEKGKSFHFPFG